MLDTEVGTPKPPDGVMRRVEALMDQSVAAHRYVIRGDTERLDLSQVNFAALAEKFKQSNHKFTEAEKLKRALNARVTQLTRLNKTRVNFAAQLQQMIQDYNLGAANVEAFFAELIRFGQTLDAEGQRASREGLNEEELAIFDLVLGGQSPLTPKNEQAVKAMARHLIGKLKESALLLDWRKKQQTRARVRRAIRDELRALGTEPGELQQLIGSLYAHVYEAYPDADRSIYA